MLVWTGVSLIYLRLLETTAQQMCNVWAHMLVAMISYIFNFRPFGEHGWLLGWQQSGTLVRLVYSFVNVHFAQFIQSVQNICVSRTLHKCVCVCVCLSVAYFIFAILFTVSDDCISSFAASASCDLVLRSTIFALSPIFLLLPTHCFYYLKMNNINSTKKKKMNGK